jgi:hypothetical protein
MSTENVVIQSDYQRFENAVFPDTFGQPNNLQIAGINGTVKLVVLRTWADGID